MYAILVTGGKQYKVSEGDVIYVEKLGVEDGATVVGTADKTGKQKKINIFKMKPKKGYRKRQGHRQPYTKVTVNAINA